MKGGGEGARGDARERTCARGVAVETPHISWCAGCCWRWDANRLQNCRRSLRAWANTRSAPSSLRLPPRHLNPKPPRPCSFAAPRTAAKPRSWGGQVCVGSCGRCGRRARSGAGGRVSCHMVCATRRRHSCARRAYGSQGGLCARRVRRSARNFAGGRRGPQRRVDSVTSRSAAVAMGRACNQDIREMYSNLQSTHAASERQIRLMTNSHKWQSEKLAAGGGRETAAKKPYNNEVPGPHH